MAINPFPRVASLDIPMAPPSAARVDPSVWGNIASLGDAIGGIRERQQLAEIMQGATDAQGNIDLNKAATAIAVSGRDPTRYLTLLEAAKREQAAESYRQESLGIAREGRDIQREGRDIEREKLNRPTQHIVPPTLMNPGGVISVPPRGGPPIMTPYPSVAPVGPQSELETPTAPIAPTAALDPETAPPYQVAGPPMPPPQGAQPAAEKPAEKPARNEGFLQRLPANAQVIVKGIADYEIDPMTLQGRDREEALAAAKMYRPDYNMSEYQKKASPPAGEISARIGLAKAFMEKAPIIRERLQSNELNSWQGAAQAAWGQGGPGELRRAIDEGSEALLRGLTGAGMSTTEATNYQRRYQFDFRDTKDTALRKLNELENALRHVTTEVGKGRGGEDMLKGFVSTFGKPGEADKEVPKVKNDAEANALIGKARDALKRDPGSRDEIYKRLRARGVSNPEVLLGQ